MANKDSGRSLVLHTVALLAGLALAWYLRDLVLLVYASALFAVLVSPLVEWVQGWRWRGWSPSRMVALAVVFGAGLVALGLVLLLVLPPLWQEGLGLVASWPQISERVLAALQRLPGLGQVGHLESYAAAASAWALATAQQLAADVASLFTVLLLTAYLLMEGEATRSWCLRLLAPAPRERLAQALARGQRRMRGWLLGQATLALCFGGSAAVVFGLLRLPDFYVLALLAGLLNFVPFLGPLLAITIAGIVAWVKSPLALVLVLIYFALYQVVENGVLTPRIMRHAVNLSGLAVVLSLAVGAALGGVLGALLAVPSAALAAELIEEYAMH